MPLTATASGRHVLTATTYSKSVLRAVAGEAADRHEFVDYFPSFEIITSPVFGGAFFEANRRTVAPAGVEFVMSTFFREFCHDGGVREAGHDVAQNGRVAEVEADDPRIEDDLACDEEILEAYG